MLLILHYIDQICSRIPLFTLNTLTCHRFVIAAVTVSSKGLCDAFCTNNLYAKVGGITVQELNMLEREFLSAIEWRLTVSKIFFPVRSPTSTPTCCSRAESIPLATCLPYWTMPFFLLSISALKKYSKNTMLTSSGPTEKGNSSSSDHVPQAGYLPIATWGVSHLARHHRRRMRNPHRNRLLSL